MSFRTGLRLRRPMSSTLPAPRPRLAARGAPYFTPSCPRVESVLQPFLLENTGELPAKRGALCEPNGRLGAADKHTDTRAVAAAGAGHGAGQCLFWCRIFVLYCLLWTSWWVVK